MSNTIQAPAQLETSFTHPWSEDDNGKLDDQGRVLQKCTAGFLDVLVTTLLGRDGELDDDDLGPAAKRTKALINAVFQEIHRLQLHPGLYPTKDMGERFIDEVKDIVTSRGNDFKLTHLIPDPETWNSLGATLGMEDLLEQLTRRDDLTLWEEFLFPGSPGSGFVLPPSNRLLPPGGTTMMALWHKKTASVEEEIKAAAARKNGQPAQPEHPLFPDGIGSIDFGGMKHDFQIVTIAPNIYYEESSDNDAFGPYDGEFDIEWVTEEIYSVETGEEVYKPSSELAKCVLLNSNKRP